MADSIRELFFGGPSARALVETIEPRRTFEDVVLPAATLAALDHALQLIRKHDLIFREWGLGERHSTGLGLAFHFAGPPGTGKTICAEALAQALGRELLVVRYAEIESRWVGQTSKHVASVFRAAERQNAVLFFDEADAIAGRRFSSASAGYEREANATVNVLLQELERFNGVIIFATNLAASLDPAFERRIRTHILFGLPGPEERERIWRSQLHQRTPLADDVDFRALAEEFPRSGGDIKNAVLKAAQLATLEPVPDRAKQIHQRHFERGMREVIASAEVMAQSLFDDAGPVGGAAIGLADRVEGLQGELATMAEQLERIEAGQGKAIERVTSEQAEATAQTSALALAAARLERQLRILRWVAVAGLAAALGALAAVVFR
ncbi:MAG TPA: ATP-binding protein [Gemmatimonadales bacterium]|jgi:SpoVK/Ycf46/Vps4 family AAA+-type ATPase|nr:ATP-binding protein [Gemmatimonadales bacterium]